MKKTIFLMAAVLLLCLALVACGSQKKTASETNDRVAEENRVGTTTPAPAPTTDDLHASDRVTDGDDHTLTGERDDSDHPVTDMVQDAADTVEDGLEEVGEDLGLTDDDRSLVRDTTDTGDVENGPYDRGEYKENELTEENGRTDTTVRN